MLDGWYCRSLANEQTGEQNFSTGNNDNNDDSDSDSQDNNEVQRASEATNTVDYKSQYRQLKQKLKFLIYENEFFQEALRTNQRRLLKVSRDRAFLLDRLLQYEKPTNSSSESEETEESSDDDATKEIKRKKLEQAGANSAGNNNRGRKKKTPLAAGAEIMADASNCPPASTNTAEKPNNERQQSQDEQQHDNSVSISMGEETQLPKHSILMDMSPEKAPPTVPAEMFSNEPSLDSETNDNMIDGNSPAHIAAEECVSMEYSNQ